MDKLWKQVIFAVLLGWMLPQMIFQAGSRGRWNTPEETVPTTAATTSPSTGSTVIPTTGPVLTYIPVLMTDGDLQMMELEDYIRGVVLAEMPASFEPEALKAQAVAARTYTLRRMTLMDKHVQGVVCTDSACCQAYLSDEGYLASRGTVQDFEKITAAVEATAGQVLTYEGKVIEATYFACSGGRTEDAAAVWGSDIPYLQAVDSPGETKAEKYDESIHFTKAEFAELLGRTLQGSPGSWLGGVTYTAGGGVETMVIGGITYSGTQLRRLLGLNSTVFTMTAADGGITVQTQGWGHRVGLSQYGADAMAVAGSDYEEILTYYYQGTQIDKIGNMG